LKNLTALAQAAVGFDTARGDLVSVQDLSFDENRNRVPVSPLKQALDAVERSPVLVKYGTILAGLSLLILFAIRPALGRAKRSPAESAEAKSPAELAAPATEPAALPSAEQALMEAERQRVQRVFDQVTETLKRDPAQSSRLLQSWIHSD
jgi:flagellar M-ring protein FliF